MGHGRLLTRLAQVRVPVIPAYLLMGMLVHVLRLGMSLLVALVLFNVTLVSLYLEFLFELAKLMGSGPVLQPLVHFPQLSALEILPHLPMGYLAPV
jgi:hypothetical protein